jgi:methylenetetrahydrofolate reductase (NADPH)
MTPATSFSFEFFPPKTDAAEQALWQSVSVLAPFLPDFVSVTYGAGGTTRARTHDCVTRLENEFGLKTAAHLTCVSASKEDVNKVVDDYIASGIDHIVALRGDMPDFAPYEPHPEGYQSTVELVAALRARGVSNISVSAYPEKHPDSPSIEHDIALLRAKAEAGATRAITQFCFDDAALLRFRDQLDAEKLAIDVLPGIMPTTNFVGAFRMAEKCGAHVPDHLRARFEGLEEDLVARRDVALAVALEQCDRLLRAGFHGIHIYTLNQAEFASQLMTELKG